MEQSIGVGAVVGLITASSLYVWNSDEFTKEQKTFLLIAMVFAPVQWIGVLVIKYYNKHKFENTPERKTEKKLDSTISNLTELKEKGILTEVEYNTKVEKIENEKEEQTIKNSLEYKQLKSLFDANVLTKEEFESKIQLLHKSSEIEVGQKRGYEPVNSKFTNFFYKFIINPFLWLLSIFFVFCAVLVLTLKYDETLGALIGSLFLCVAGILISPIVSVRILKFLHNKFSTKKV